MAQIALAQELRVPVCATVDVERVRHATRALAESLGFDTVDTEMVVLAASELATNLAERRYLERRVAECARRSPCDHGSCSSPRSSPD